MKLYIPEEKLIVFCNKWLITELSLFGSALGEDFTADSDVDVLVSFKSGAGWSLLDHVEMQDELSIILGRDVDLVSRRGIERSRNHIRRDEILRSARVIYAAA